jgi:sec-independent protein translocase protein TatB
VFDVGISEIMVIAVVALIVIGPEKLPKTARTLGHLFGRLQRYVSDVKADINREIELDELRKLQQEVQTAAKAIETSVTSAANEMQAGVRGVESELNATAAEAAAPAAEMLPLSATQMADPAANEIAPAPVAAPVAAPAAPLAEAAATAAPTATPHPTPPAPAPASASAAEPAQAPAEPNRQASLPGFERG